MTTSKITPSEPTGTKLTEIKILPQFNYFRVYSTYKWVVNCYNVYVDGEWICTANTADQACAYIRKYYDRKRNG